MDLGWVDGRGCSPSKSSEEGQEEGQVFVLCLLYSSPWAKDLS